MKALIVIALLAVQAMAGEKLPVPSATFTSVYFNRPPESWQGKRLVDIREKLGFIKTNWKVISNDTPAAFPPSGQTLVSVELENKQGDRWTLRATEREGKWVLVMAESPEFQPLSSK